MPDELKRNLDNNAALRDQREAPFTVFSPGWSGSARASMPT